MISIVSPIYNEEDNLNDLCQSIVAVLEDINEEFEIILVENGSFDKSFEVMRRLRENDRRIKYIRLSRNFGHQGGIIAGLTHASGDAIITIDGDLQQPPELISELIKRWKGGYEVVFTTKKVNKRDGHSMLFLKSVFYKILTIISDVNLSFGQSDYRLLDRKVVDVILNIPERNKFLRGMVEWVGFAQIGIEYKVDPRKRGDSKFSFWSYVGFALDGIFSFSTIPLKIFLWVGVLIAIACGFYASYYFTIGLINLFIPGTYQLPPGWATITFSILFLGSIQLIGIGCLGEYIVRIFTQTKQRPDFVVKEISL